MGLSVRVDLKGVHVLGALGVACGVQCLEEVVAVDLEAEHRFDVASLVLKRLIPVGRQLVHGLEAAPQLVAQVRRQEVGEHLGGVVLEGAFGKGDGRADGQPGGLQTCAWRPLARAVDADHRFKEGQVGHFASLRAEVADG